MVQGQRYPVKYGPHLPPPVIWVQGQITLKRKQLYEDSWNEKGEALGDLEVDFGTYCAS